MRYKTGQKEQTRLKMLEAAGRGFRSRGYAGVGVDGLAKAAGVTSGAFYAHFGSKHAAFDAALAAGLDEVIDAVPRYQSEYGSDWVREFVEYYLGRRHRSDLECGCAMAALTPEVVRAGHEVRAAFEKRMALIADLVARGLSGGSGEERLSRAWALLSVLIGGVNIARAMKSEKAGDEVAEAFKVAALKVAGRTRAKAQDK